MYQIYNEQGDIQNTDTKQVFSPVEISRPGRKYLAWLKEGNEPEPLAPPQKLVVDENEEKIQAKMREMAIMDLQKSGELAADYK